MAWRGALLRQVNRSLLPFDLQIKRESVDLEARLLSGVHHYRMVEKLAEIIAPFLQQELILGPRLRIDCPSEVGSFLEDYLALPQRAQGGGNRFTNLLWLYLIARVRQPETIIESGTFRGLSAWALNKGAPQAELLTFDIRPEERQIEVPAIRYLSHDWAEHRIDANPQTTLLFFDDHVDQARRVREAHERDFCEMIFDDDLPVETFANRTGHAGALPKISFLFDPNLNDGEVIEWQAKGRRHYYKVDRAYLDETRLMINQFQRLPDLSWYVPSKAQLPLTLLKLELSA